MSEQETVPNEVDHLVQAYVGLWEAVSAESQVNDESQVDRADAVDLTATAIRRLGYDPDELAEEYWG